MGAFSHITFAAKSDVGRKRKNNEDSFGAFSSVGVYCVADGMGGGDDGEVASAATVKAIESFANECQFPHDAAYSSSCMVARIQAYLNNASTWILERAKVKHLKGCGSTFVGVCFDASRPDTATALHAGDSRLYHIRGCSIRQITKDHSAAELIGAKDESEVNPMFRGMILRAVGIQPVVEIESTPFSLKKGDLILLCSDGLYRMVSDKQMVSIICDQKSLSDAVDALIATANASGGIDNITAELIAVGELPPSLPVVNMPEMPCKERGVETVASIDMSTSDTNSDGSPCFEASSQESINSQDYADGENLVANSPQMTIPEAIDERISNWKNTNNDSDIIDNNCIGHTNARFRTLKIVITISLVILLMVLGISSGFLHKNNNEVITGCEVVSVSEVENEVLKEDLFSPTENSGVAQHESNQKLELDVVKEVERKRIEEDRIAELNRQKAIAAEVERKRIEEDRIAELNRQKAIAAEVERKRIEEERIADAKRIHDAQLVAIACEAELNRRYDDALLAFEEVYDKKFAIAFGHKIESLSVADKKLLDAICVRFRPLSVKSNLSRTEKLKIAIELTKDIQTVVLKLIDYAEEYLIDADNQLTDVFTKIEYRKGLKDSSKRMSEFLINARIFINGEPSDPNVMFKCLKMIHSVPLWF